MSYASDDRLWRFSVNWAIADRFDDPESRVFAWTAPEGLRCGNRLALYEGGRGNRSAFIAIGRAVTDAVRAHLGDRKHWAWVEWLPLATPVSLIAIRDATGYSHVSGSHVSVLDRGTLVVVEAKLRAQHRPSHDYDPVDQVLNYVAVAEDALRGRRPKLAIRPMLVAYEFDPAERDHARAEGIECRLLSRKGPHSLRPTP
jgi:hypothetical protein